MNYKSCFPCISSAPPQDCHWWDPSTASANASAFHISAESATTASTSTSTSTSTRFHPTHGHGPQGRDTNIIIESSLLTSRRSKAAHWGRPYPYPTSLVDSGAQGKGEKGKINHVTDPCQGFNLSITSRTLDFLRLPSYELFHFFTLLQSLQHWDKFTLQAQSQLGPCLVEYSAQEDVDT